ncbi:MAG: hypothetical protein M1830_006856 [Pleopsidium flavum]|nr:MAG: hypothetical protein M1830_006856 [Pleopsidium flavum]
MPRSTKDRVEQKPVKQRQTKGKVAKPRQTTSTRLRAKDFKPDTPSVAPHDHTDSYEGRTANEEVVVALNDGTTTDMAQPVLTPAENDLRDPFHCLSSYEVGVIIAFLPPKATHTLRLVSKFWKASSEFHNAGHAIRTHFPNAALASKTYETPEEANLHFRRLLYHHRSLQRGFATRAMECTSAKFWHLHGNTLLWANPKGSISIHDLRSDKNIPNTASKTVHLSLREHFDTEILLHDALPTSVGDLLVHVTHNVKGTERYPGKLIRMSREGGVIWEVPRYFRDHIGSLAMGESAFYYIFQSSRWQEYNNFVARNIDDGSFLYHTVITDRVLPWLNDPYTFKLFNHGKWASYRFLDGNTWIFDTVTGKQVYSFKGSKSSSLVFSEVEDKLWEVDRRYESASWRYVFIYDEKSKSMVRQELRYKWADFHTYDEKSETFIRQRVWFRHAPTQHTTVFAFGGDRHLCLRIKHDAKRAWRDGGTDDPFARMAIASLVPRVDYTYPGAGEPLLVESGPMASITLPDNPLRRVTTRRGFEASLPWIIRAGDFFGMVGEYLVFHSPHSEYLVVLDFWPTW